MFEGFDGSTVLITGGTGSLGAVLVSLLHQKHKCRKIIVFSRDEQKQHWMRQQLEEIIPELRFMLGDVRDFGRLKQAFQGADYVINAAAYKHIESCEYAPLEAIKTNVDGAANVVLACIECGVKRAIQVSSDKACAPVLTYGATKFCAERLFLAANSYNKTNFKAIRYGNVIASRGSVIETWMNLKAQGIREFPITDARSTRFWFPIQHAADCVVVALSSECKIAVPRIPSMKVIDVARAVDPDCTFREIGLRVGEKLHECLVTPEERIPGFENGFYSDKNDLWWTVDEFRKWL